MEDKPRSLRIFNSDASDMPLWLTSCHKRRDAKIKSRLVILPSLFPPFAVLSYSASARNPFFSCPSGGEGCGVKFPNSSVPLSIEPLPLRSKANHASSELVEVHAKRRGVPLPTRSKTTPFSELVRLNPLPFTSTRIGEMEGSQQPLSLVGREYPSGQPPDGYVQGSAGMQFQHSVKSHHSSQGVGQYNSLTLSISQAPGPIASFGPNVAPPIIELGVHTPVQCLRLNSCPISCDPR
jgi:hypothetical protein